MCPFSPLLVDAVTTIDRKPAWERHGDAAAEEPFIPSGDVGHGGTERERAKSPRVENVKKEAQKSVRIRVAQPCYSREHIRYESRGRTK